VTDPSGNETGGKTDENGTFVLPFGMAGGYNVSLLRNGSVVKTIAVMVFPRSGEDGRNTALFSPELMQILLILIVLLLIGAAIFFLKRRKAGEPPKPGP
jgi:LPXTG-motif cell wall-anchored protein